MGTILLIFTFCGLPDSVLIMDVHGLDYGPIVGAPESVVERINELLVTPDTPMEIIPLEELSGTRCA